MKIIIPVAGPGTKLRPHTHTQPKALMPVAGKPILSHIIEHLQEGGFKEFIFVIGYLGDKIESYLKSKYPNLILSFVVQEPREGLGHAVWLTRKKISPDDELLIVLGDTIFDFDLSAVIKNKHSVLGVRKVEDPRLFGVAELDSEGNVTRLTEKPAIPKSNMALVGIYFIKHAGKLMDALEFNIKNKKHSNNEYHLTDGLMKMIEDGEQVSTFQVGNWFDCGEKSKLLETNAILLNRNIKSQKAYTFPNTILIPPVSIAENCSIKDSIIGPHVSIGEHSIISNCIIRDSIIGAYSQLETAVLHQSVVGNDAYLKGLSQSLNIGDSNEIDFSN